MHISGQPKRKITYKYSQPSALLRSLLKNSLLNDPDTALVVRRVCETGSAQVTEEMIADFKRRNPYHEQTHQVLSEWIEEDVKIPEEDANRIAI